MPPTTMLGPLGPITYPCQLPPSQQYPTDISKHLGTLRAAGYTFLCEHQPATEELLNDQILELGAYQLDGEWPGNST